MEHRICIQDFEKSYIDAGGSLHDVTYDVDSSKYIPNWDFDGLDIDEHEARADDVNHALAIFSQQTIIDDLRAQLKAVHESRVEFVQYCNQVESGNFVLVPRKMSNSMIEAAVQAMFGPFNEKNLSGQGAYSNDIAPLANVFVNQKLSKLWGDILKDVLKSAEEARSDGNNQ